jgi:hypothetical protein
MKSKDQQLLEEAYNDVVQKMLAGSNNPGFDPKNPWFSGQAFKPWAPKGGWPTKKTATTKPKAVAKAKEVEPEEDEDLDVEGDPVGRFQSIAEPQPEEDHSDSMMFVSNQDLEKIYNADEATFDFLFKGSEGATEEKEGIVFRYLAPQVRQKMEQKIQALLNK